MRTILMGIGNILLQDEGVGVHAVKEIEKRYLLNG
jgi:hydrogenase maturation protease